MASSFELLSGIVVVLLALYYYFTKNYNFWNDRGVPGPKPIPGFGNLAPVMFSKMFIGDFAKHIYEKYKNEPLIGIFTRRSPVLMVTDPDLIKDVLIRDFSNFSHRGAPVHEKADPLTLHLFNLEPRRWRPLRHRLSPVFTSGKLKEMFSMIVDCSDHLVEYLDKLIEKGEAIECRELTAKFTTDVIGNCAFGIEMQAMSNEESEFRKMGRQVFATTWFNKIKLLIRQSVPWLYNLTGYVLPLSKNTKFFIDLVKDTIEYREKNNINRHDFINNLMELKRHPEMLGDIELTDELLSAQAFVFFIAGFETSSTTISNALYELALNPTIQDNLRKEINEEFLKNNGDLKYDNIKKMVYLDQVFRETLRKYPPVTVLMREAQSKYTFSGTKVTIPKGTVVWIPNYAIQRDSEIYPDPDKFDPERFSVEACKTRHPMHYLPFGDGPRNCIGARFGIYQTKIGLTKIIQNYKISVCDETSIPLINNPRAFILTPTDGIRLKITKINNN